mgnify:CR=1 FL=1
MDYYIGIDGGGTKTIAFLSNDLGEVVGKFTGGAVNYHSEGKDNVLFVFKEMFQFFHERFLLSKNDIKRICLGCAAVNTKEDERVIRSLFSKLKYENELLIYNDSYIALVAGNGTAKGAVLISGTGSIAYGIALDGNQIRVGGWGHLIDDEGSGYAIAREGLKKVMEGYDGRSESTKIYDKVKEKLGINGHRELISFIYSSKTKKQDIAALAPCVLDLYGKDNVADAIINKAVNDLCYMVEVLSKRMELKTFSLCLSGSVLLKSNVMRRLLEEKIAVVLPMVTTHLPYKEPVLGALMLALNSR